MSWGREDGLVQEILPVACEFLFGHYGRLDGEAPSIREHDGVADCSSCGVAEIERGKAKPTERLHEAKAGLLIISQHVSGNRSPVMRRQPDFVGLGYEITDREDHAFPNYHPAAFPHRAERCGREGILWNQGAQTHNRSEDRIGIHPLILEMLRNRASAA